MVKKRASIPRLGRLELEILEYLWRVSEADVQETHAALGKPRGITPNTVGSALERLFRKKLLSREKVSHAYRYQPSLNRDAFMAQAMVDAAGGLRALSEQGLLTAFIDVVTDANDDALDQLERLIRQKRRQQK